MQQKICGSDYTRIKMPTERRKIEGMITEAEERFLFMLTSELWSGQGSVVEVGSYKGRSAHALALGMNASNYSGELHCYDDFGSLGYGENSVDTFRDNLADFNFVHSHQATFTDAQWNGGEIDILFLDAPKNLSSLSTVLTTFGRHLVPGRSHLICQDYMHPLCFAIPAALYSIRERLQFFDAVIPGATMAFQVMDSLDFPRIRPWQWDYRLWTVREALRNWEIITEMLSGQARERVRLQLPFLLHDMGEHKAAIAAVRALEPTQEHVNKLVKLWPKLSASRPELLPALLGQISKQHEAGIVKHVDLADLSIPEATAPRRSVISRLATRRAKRFAAKVGLR